MENEIHANKCKGRRRRKIRGKYCGVRPPTILICAISVMYCIAGSPFYQNTKQTLSDIFCRRWRKEFFPWIQKEKNIFFCEEKSFLFSILDHKEGDSFILVSKDKYGGVALSSYILINSRPASELSLLPHTNVISLRWWWLKYDLLLLTFLDALASLGFMLKTD